MLKFLFILSALLFQGAVMAKNINIQKPEQLEFGSSLQETIHKLKPYCTSITFRKILPITAPLAQNSQVQIDCSGFVYAGKKRFIEVVFQDDQLDIVWILFPEKEKSILLESFISTYGQPTMEIDYGTLFLQANAAIRNDPSEVLFASQRQVKIMMHSLQNKERD